MLAKHLTQRKSSYTLNFTMPANSTPEEKTLIERAVSWLQSNLPSSWKADTSSQTISSFGGSQLSQVVDNLIVVTAPQGGSAIFLVEAKSTFAPRDAERFLSGMARQLRILNPNYPILVVTPWLSKRTQEVLAKDGINFLDLTGNVRIALNSPSIFIIHTGAPETRSRHSAHRRGSRGQRPVAWRGSSSTSPPHRRQSNLEGHRSRARLVSRLLQSLDEDALIQPHRKVESHPSTFHSGSPGDGRRPTTSLSPIKRLPLSLLKVQRRFFAVSTVVCLLTPRRSAVTGSFSAVRFAPVAAPSLLVLYCSEPSLAASDRAPSR